MGKFKQACIDHKCRKCGKVFDYLDHAEGDHTLIDGTIHTRCPHCGEPERVPQ